MIISLTLRLQRMTSLKQSSSLSVLEASVPDSQENLICLPLPAPALNKYTASTGGLPSDPPSVSATLPVWLLTGRWDHVHSLQALLKKFLIPQKLLGMDSILFAHIPALTLMLNANKGDGKREANLYVYVWRFLQHETALWSTPSVPQCPNYWWVTGSIYRAEGKLLLYFILIQLSANRMRKMSTRIT